METTDIVAKNILIVEDDMLLSLVEERLIEKLGHRVVAKVTTGEEAITKTQELQPDLILMDIILKGKIDGIEAMNKIRSFSEVPVIYLSGNSDRYNYERAKKTDFVEYLVKPITSKDLIEPLNRAFNNKHENVASTRQKIRKLTADSGHFINKSA